MKGVGREVDLKSLILARLLCVSSPNDTTNGTPAGALSDTSRNLRSVAPRLLRRDGPVIHRRAADVGFGPVD
jgi:hypothetical protein